MTFQSSVIKLLSEEIFKFLNLSVFKAFQAFHYYSHSISLKTNKTLENQAFLMLCSVFHGKPPFVALQKRLKEGDCVSLTASQEQR